MKATDDKYKREFISYILQKIKDHTAEGYCVASAEYDAHIESIGDEANDEDADPYYDADECLSYWTV